jgi:hypothetical protein
MELHWILYYFLFESYAVIVIIVMKVSCLLLIKFILALYNQSSLSAKVLNHQKRRIISWLELPRPFDAVLLFD